MAEGFWAFKISDVLNALILFATIFAIYLGPIRAVEAARKKEDIRDAARRKREIFAALMRTRRIYMHPDHVGALNLIQLEFIASDKVIRAYRDYIANLSETVPNPGPPLDAFQRRRGDLFFDLLHEIAKTVGCDIDKRDLERLAYVPTGWETDEGEMRIFRLAVIELLHGRRALPVAPFQPQPAVNPFPPPPGATS